MDMEHMAFEDCAFHGLVAYYALHYQAKSTLDKVIREFARVLKPGAVLGLDDNVVPGASNVKAYNAFEKVRDPSHNRAYTSAGLRSILEQAGFEILTLRELEKEMEFDDWADRQHVSPANKGRLLRMLDGLPALKPRTIDGTVHFSLREAVIVATSRNPKT